MNAALAFSVFWSGVLCPVIGRSVTERQQTSLTAYDVKTQSRQPYIINGKDVAVPGSYPWQISLQRNRDERHICGGSLLSAEFVVTAAHCVEGIPAGKLTVVVGLHDLNRTQGSPQDHAIKEIIIHEFYMKGDGMYPNDIALLRLATPVTFTKYAQPVAMDVTVTSHGLGSCVITGWGFTGFNQRPIVPNILQEARTSIITRSHCAIYWGSVYISDAHVCSWTGVTSTCMGDSGGPLICRHDDGSFRLLGVTSWGSGSCSSSMPVVYTRLSAHTDWIITNMA